MKDKAHISQIISDLKRIWEYTPDLRLGQLLLNAVNGNENKLFYIEDQELIDTMYHEIYQKLLKEYKDGQT